MNPEAANGEAGKVAGNCDGTAGKAPTVTVLRDRYVKAGTFTAHATVLSLDAALERSWPSDAHCQQGHSRLASGGPARMRASSDTIGRNPFVATIVMFDLDPPSHAVTPEWRSQSRIALAELTGGAAGGSAGITRGYAPSLPGVDCIQLRSGSGRSYETARGARLLFELAEPVEIADATAAARWRESYLELCSVLRDRYGIDADAACCDFGRLFRLPRVIRPEMGATPHPVSRSRQAPVHAPSIAWQPQPADTAPVTLGVSKHGPIFDRLLQLGHVRAEMSEYNGRRRWWVRCPYEHEHGGRTGAPYGDCVFHEPYEPCGVGWIHCYHAACLRRDQADFRRAVREAAPDKPPTDDTVLSQLNARDPSGCDDDLLALRSGRDRWSRVKGAELLAAVRAKPDGAELIQWLAKHVCFEPGDFERVPANRHAADACRWFLRGLSLEHAFRRATLRQETYA